MVNEIAEHRHFVLSLRSSTHGYNENYTKPKNLKITLIRDTCDTRKIAKNAEVIFDISLHVKDPKPRADLQNLVSKLLN